MNLSSLSDADLAILRKVAMAADADDASEITVFHEVEAEMKRRAVAGQYDSRTGFRIEFRNGSKWQDAAQSYFGGFWQAGVNRFFATREDAEKAIARLNGQIREGDWESWSKTISTKDVRFVKITTTRQVA